MRKYEITKEQINEYIKKQPRLGATKQTLQDLFPDAFKQEFQVSKWYKSYIGTFAFYSGEESMCGISSCGQWNDAIITKESIEKCCLGVWEEATQEEVLELLKEESIKRGFTGEVYFTTPNGTDGDSKESDSYRLNPKPCILWWGMYAIFRDGRWGYLRRTIARQEAEKQLGMKIID